MRYSIFGESHGSAIGVVLEQVPPGLVLDREAISKEMARRAPGKSPPVHRPEGGGHPRDLIGCL